MTLMVRAGRNQKRYVPTGTKYQALRETQTIKGQLKPREIVERQMATVAANPPSYDWLRGPKSEEHKRKISEWNRGKVLSDSTKAKISESHARLSGASNPAAKIWLITSPDGVSYTVNGSLKKFCEEHNLPFATMGKLGRTGRECQFGRCKGWSINQR